MTKTPEKRSSSSLRDLAYRGLKRLLILQQIPAGTRLREPEWSGKLKVNRTALREAFARLEAEGWIERGPATGYFVPRLSESDRAEVIRLRIALESLAIEQICATDGDLTPRLAPLKQACDQFERFMDEGYSLAAIEADRRFHEALVSAARMKRLEALYQRAPLPLIHREVTDDEQWRQAAERTLREHREMIASIAARKPDAAIRQMHEHLRHRATVPLRP